MEKQKAPRKYLPDHPWATKNGMIVVSRLVMGEHLGRKLNFDERIRFINGDVNDSRIENLALIPRPGKDECRFDGCSRKVHTKGLCLTHYEQSLSGKPLMPIRRKRDNDQCIEPGCDNPHWKRNPQCREHRNAYMRSWNHKNGRVSSRSASLKRLYGLSIEEYDEMLVKQKGVCAICKQPETALFRDGRIKRLSVDHNHQTGAVRGLLCRACNSLLADASDNIATLKSAIAYLR